MNVMCRVEVFCVKATHILESCYLLYVKYEFIHLIN